MNLRSEKTQTALNLITGLVTMTVQFAVSFFLSPFLVKHLGAEANGFAQLATTFVTYASLVTMAFNSMAGRFISVSYYQGKLEEANKYYTSVFAVNILMILLLLPATIFIIADLQHLINIGNTDIQDLKIVFICVFANFFLGLISTLYSLSLYIKNLLFYGNILNVLKIVLNAVLLFAAFSLLPIKIYYISFVAFLLSLLALPFYIYIHQKYLEEIHFSKQHFSFKAVKELFLSGIWNTITQCGHIMMTGMDLILSNLFVSPFAMGLVSVSKTVLSIVSQITNVVNVNFAPSVTKNWAEGDKKTVLHSLRMNMTVSCILVSIPIVTFCVMGYDFYTLWQPTLDAKKLAILSILGCINFIPVAGTQTLYNVFTASNHLKVNSITFLITGALNVLLVFILLKTFSGYGMYIIVGVSSCLSIVRNLVVTLPYTAYLLQLKWFTFYREVGLALLCAAINVLIGYLVLNVIPITNWMLFVVDGIMIGFGTLIAESFILLNSEEKAILQKIINKVVRRK